MTLIISIGAYCTEKQYNILSNLSNIETVLCQRLELGTYRLNDQIIGQQLLVNHDLENERQHN